MEDIDALWKKIQENPDYVNSEEITDEQIIEIQKRVNPYATLKGMSNVTDDLVMSVVNLKDSFMKRFLMTSLVGFIYQMAHEYEVPVENRRWVPPKAKEADASLFDLESLKKELELNLELVNRALHFREEGIDYYAKSTDVKIPTDFVASSEIITQEESDRMQAEHTASVANAIAAQKEFTEAYKHCHKNSSMLSFLVTFNLFKLGESARDKVRAAAKEASEYPDARSEIVTKFEKDFPIPSVQKEVPVKVAKNIIKKFLDEYLHFDPTIHVRSGELKKETQDKFANYYKEGVVADPWTFPSKKMLRSQAKVKSDHTAIYNCVSKSPRKLASVLNILLDEDLKEMLPTILSNESDFKAYLIPIGSSDLTETLEHIPPMDTFHRYSYYTEVNYEKLKLITTLLYPERDDLEFAIAPWHIIKGATEEDRNKEFEKFCQKHEDDTPTALRSVAMGKWSFIGDLEKNRKKISFYNKQTGVIKEILQRVEEEAELGKQLMEKRVVRTKAKNIAEDGPDAPGLAQYMKTRAQSGVKTAASLNAKKVISDEEMLRLNAADGDLKAAEELRVLDQLKASHDKLVKIEESRVLTETERLDKKSLEEDIKRAREMLSVPKDAVQVDVFSHNAKTGEFSKSSFYTEADDPTK